MNGYTDTGKTTKDGSPIYKRDDEVSRRAYINVNGHPRIARIHGMACGRGLAEKYKFSELID